MSEQIHKAVFSKMKQQRVLITFIGLGIFLRIAASLYLGDKIEILPGIFDQLSYDQLSRNLIAGNGFSFNVDWWPATRAGEPTAHWSYLMTSFLFVVYRLFGYHPLYARLIQAVIAGILVPLFTYRISKRVFQKKTVEDLMYPNPIPLLASAWAVLYGYFIYYAAALMSESFYIVAILWSIDCALRIVDRYKSSADNKVVKKKLNTDWVLWLELGIAMGMASLMRQSYIIFIPFMLVWLWWNDYKINKLQKSAGITVTHSIIAKPLLQGTLITLVTVIVLILPFTYYNYLRFDRFVLLNSNSGYAFFWGNHPVHGYKFVPLFTSDMPSYQELIPDELLHLDEAAMDSALMKKGFGFIFDNPVRYLVLTISRIPEHFIFWPLPSSHPISNLTRVGSLGIALPFGLFGMGMWISDRVKKRYTDSTSGVLLFLYYIVHNGIYLASWAGIRYRLPTDSILIMFAAFGLYHVFSKVKIMKMKLMF